MWQTYFLIPTSARPKPICQAKTRLSDDINTLNTRFLADFSLEILFLIMAITMLSRKKNDYNNATNANIMQTTCRKLKRNGQTIARFLLFILHECPCIFAKQDLAS